MTARLWRLGVPLAVVAVAVLLGAVAAGGLPGGPAPLARAVELLATVPPAGLVAGVAVALVLPLTVRHWGVSLAVFLGWLVVEDLVRKLAGNDLRVYFVKDLIYAAVVVGLIASVRFRRAWWAAVGRAGWPLLALIAWAVAMSLPSALVDPRVPLVGLRLDFMYVPLVVAGFLIGRDHDRLRRWLVGLALLGGAASAIGVVQAIIGPEFLAPGVPVRGLPNLVLVRGTALSGPVYRPTGTFVDPGRFASMAVIALAVALAASQLARGRTRWLTLGAATSAAAAVWVSGGRAGFLIGALLVAVAGIAGPWAARRPTLGRAVGAAAVGLAGVLLFTLLAPDLFTSRLLWYQQTLDPRSPRNEWAFRWNSYWGATVRGVQLGGLIGQGTGTESLGLQYLYEGTPPDADVYKPNVEGGYAAVAVEWGLVGLALWVWWTLSWLQRLWRATAARRAPTRAAAGLVLYTWVVFFLVIGFFGGMQGFQNYLANAYFWLFSGMLYALPHETTIGD